MHSLVFLVSFCWTWTIKYLLRPNLWICERWNKIMRQLLTDVQKSVILQNRNFSKEILTIIIIPPWFQACIYWKKFVIWRHHLQPSIFSMIVSLFHRSTWSSPQVNETVIILFATIHYNKRSAVDSRKIWRVCLFEENHCSPAVLKVPIYFTEQVAIIFVWKVVKCTKSLTEIPFFHGEPA